MKNIFVNVARKWNICVVKAKFKSVKSYEDTWNEVRKIVANDPRMTIQRFYDLAVRDKIKTINNEQSTGLPARGENHSETY